MSNSDLGKIFTLLGFAYRSRKVVIGIDAIKKIKPNGDYLIMVSAELSENSLKKIDGDRIVFEKNDWEKIIFSEGVKAILVKDKNINRVIKDCYENRRRGLNG